MTLSKDFVLLKKNKSLWSSEWLCVNSILCIDCSLTALTFKMMLLSWSVRTVEQSSLRGIQSFINSQSTLTFHTSGFAKDDDFSLQHIAGDDQIADDVQQNGRKQQRMPNSKLLKHAVTSWMKTGKIFQMIYFGFHVSCYQWYIDRKRISGGSKLGLGATPPVSWPHNGCKMLHCQISKSITSHQ